MRRGKERTLNVQVTREDARDSRDSYVITLDDITDLVIAQRSTAWSDVARRIAHEIKNPLTPIQLSAERIKRRFGKQIDESDRAVFDQCTDTIVRQVGDIGRMVDEFSAFARMPKPTKEKSDLRAILKDAAFLREISAADTKFTTELGDIPLEGMFDARMLGQPSAISSRMRRKPSRRWKAKSGRVKFWCAPLSTRPIRVSWPISSTMAAAFPSRTVTAFSNLI